MSQEPYIMILGWLGGLKGKKRCKMTKNSVHHAFYLRDHTSYDLHSWYTFEKGQYLPVFFVFIPNFNFQGC